MDCPCSGNLPTREAMDVERDEASQESTPAFGEAERPVALDRVVIGVDFHESSREAALWVMHHLAADANHELIHVVDPPELPKPLRALFGSGEQLRLAARAGAEQRLDDLRVGVSGPGATTHIVEGRAATEILRMADQLAADLIVTGDQGPRRGITALLGSTAEQVLFDSRVPVLLARKVPETSPRRLLVAIDESELSARVLAWAAHLQERFGATATVLNVIDRRVLIDEFTEVPEVETFQRTEDAATAAMQEWLEARVRESGLAKSLVQAKVVAGDPAYEIIAEAARMEADLVLIGSRGDDVARTPVIGRIVNKVVRSAPCSVLVVVDRQQGIQTQIQSPARS